MLALKQFAGIDHTGAHIFKIHDPGIATCFDTPFFAAIGIGEPHAASQFMLAKFEKRWSVEKTLFLTYSAKTLAEAAAGVGKMTDMVVIRIGAKPPVHALTPDELNALDEILKTATEKSDKAREEAYASIREYIEKSTIPNPAPPTTIPQADAQPIEKTEETEAPKSN